MRYREAGVDVPRGDEVKRAIAARVRETWTPGVRPLAGGFAGLMDWPGGGVLAASMDGIGTKLHLATRAGRVADAGADLVYHGANDLLCHGARPLAFLDYVAQPRLEPATVLAVVEGMARACRELGCALLGGETAQMPDTYLPGVADVAGCILGVVDPDHVLDGRAVRPGDLLLGLASEGLHTNGYSLARRVLDRSGLDLHQRLPDGSGESVADALLARHRPYGPALLPLLPGGRVRALAHVTGGGIAGNLSRVLPAGCRARIRAGSWTWPAAFRWLQQAGEVPQEEMRATFNLGIGMVACVAPAEAERLASELSARGERVMPIGEVIAGEAGVEWVEG